MKKKCLLIFLGVVFVMAGFAGQSWGKTTYKLGINLVLTGPWADFGVGMLNSFKLAINYSNILIR